MLIGTLRRKFTADSYVIAPVGKDFGREGDRVASFND